jgi:hypothetical protein
MCIRNWIAAFGVLGTWLVFVGAIWGEKIRSSLFKPRLSVMLDDPRGGVPITETISIFTNSQQGQQVLQQYERLARYYYLSVKTERRWPLAHDVRILLIRLEKPDPGGQPTTVWTGEIPFGWEHAQIQPASPTLGRPTRADFVVAAQDPVDMERRNQLHLMTVIEPSNMQRSHYSTTQFWVTVIATSNEGDSPRFGWKWLGMVNGMLVKRRWGITLKFGHLLKRQPRPQRPRNGGRLASWDSYSAGCSPAEPASASPLTDNRSSIPIRRGNITARMPSSVWL